MDLAAAEQRELADGTPYVLIPTNLVMDAGPAGRLAVSSQTLGLLENDGAWYLVRISDAGMVGVLRQVYPEFNGVEFPAETIKAVAE
jgi:hypothetical protein